MTSKLCPLLTQRIPGMTIYNNEHYVSCLEDKCQLWNSAIATCSLVGYHGYITVTNEIVASELEVDSAENAFQQEVVATLASPEEGRPD